MTHMQLHSHSRATVPLHKRFTVLLHKAKISAANCATQGVNVAVARH